MKEIFVFGSNREGRHGKGAALFAYKNYGAIYGQAEGRQGNSYAIITKELKKDQPPVTISEIEQELFVEEEEVNIETEDKSTLSFLEKLQSNKARYMSVVNNKRIPSKVPQ